MNVDFFKGQTRKTLFFSTFPDKINALQWHSYEVKNLENNKDITLLGIISNDKISNF